MKLSPAQQKVIDIAKLEIDTARKYPTFEDYFDGEIGPRCNSSYNTVEKQRAVCPDDLDGHKQYWERKKEGIVRTICNGRTLERLQKLGLIEIIYNASNTHCNVDTVRILNY